MAWARNWTMCTMKTYQFMVLLILLVRPSPGSGTESPHQWVCLQPWRLEEDVTLHNGLYVPTLWQRLLVDLLHCKYLLSCTSNTAFCFQELGRQRDTLAWLAVNPSFLKSHSQSSPYLWKQQHSSVIILFGLIASLLLFTHCLHPILLMSPEPGPTNVSIFWLDIYAHAVTLHTQKC